MMDKKKPVEKDVVDTTLVRKMGETVENSPSQFRTVEHIDSTTGDKTRLRTKGGNPQAIVEKMPKKQAAGCPKPPFVEVGFKYAATPGTDPNRNPYTVTSGYRTWHGEPNPSLPISPTNPKKVKRYNFSHDGIFCIEARKPKRLTFKDANNKKVELLLAERPNDPDDATNEENQEYAESGAGTFVNVAKARATSQGTEGADFKYSEGRYRYREWYSPEWQDIGWALKFVPNSAFKFMTKRLRKIAVLLVKKGSEAVKQIEWIFCNKDTPAYTGTPSSPQCAENNLREKSFSGRSFYSPNGHLSELVMRAGYEKMEPPYSSGNEVKFSLKRPGSILMNIDPEWVIPESGSTTHPGVDSSIDIQDFAAFGNPWHGYFHYSDAAPTPVLYTDPSKSTVVTGAPSSFPGNGYIQYYNFGGTNPLADGEAVIRKNTDGTEMYERFYKDAIFVGGKTLIASGIYSALNNNEFLFKDDSKNVWVLASETTARLQPGGYGAYITDLRLALTRQYGDLATNFDWNNHGVTPGYSNQLKVYTLNFTQENCGLLHFDGGVSPNLYGDAVFPAYRVGASTYAYYYGDAKIFPRQDGRGALVVSRAGDWLGGIRNAGGRIYRAFMLTLSGSGALEADAENSIAIGDGIVVSAVEYPLHNTRRWEGKSIATKPVVNPYKYTVNPHEPSLSHAVNHSPLTVGCPYDPWGSPVDPSTYTNLVGYDIPRDHTLDTARADGWYSHAEYDYFYDDGVLSAVSVRHMAGPVSFSTNVIGSWVDESRTYSNHRCTPTYQGPDNRGLLSEWDDVFVASQEPSLQYRDGVLEVKVAILVRGAIIHEIGLRITLDPTSNACPSFGQITNQGPKNVSCLSWGSEPTVVTLPNNSSVTVTTTYSHPTDGWHTRDVSLWPMLKIIPMTAGATKKRIGTQSYFNQEWSSGVGVTNMDFAYTLVFEGRTEADRNATASWPTKLVYRDAVLDCVMGDFHPVTIDATEEYYSANGWAYNPRTKQLVLVPLGETAVFI